MKRCCANCFYLHSVHQFVEDGKLHWFDSLPNVKDENGNDISVNAYRCLKFCDIGDEIEEKDIHTEDVCDDFDDGSDDYGHEMY